MWKVSSMYMTDDDEKVFVLVNTEDDDFSIEVDEVRFIVLDNYGLIKL